MVRCSFVSLHFLSSPCLVTIQHPPTSVFPPATPSPPLLSYSFRYFAFLGYVNEEDQEGHALKMIKAMLEWRQSMKVDEIAATEYKRKPEFLQIWPHGFHGMSLNHE